MSTQILTGTYSAGFYLNSPITTLSITATGYVEGPGIYSPDGATAAYTIINDGRVKGASRGIYLSNGGSVTNGSDADTTASITGTKAGLEIAGAAGAVVNFATISGAAGTAGVGVYLAAGGSLTNGSATDTKALIQGGDGVLVTSKAGRVHNFGTIQGDGFSLSRAGVHLMHGGSLTNGSSADTTALVRGDNLGVIVAGAAGTVTNFGTILGGAISKTFTAGIELLDGGRVTNGSPQDTEALIRGNRAVVIGGAAVGTVINFGTIYGYAVGVGVYLGDGGVLTNGSTIDTKALIFGGNGVLASSKAAATIRNFGTIEDDGIAGHQAGVNLKAGGSVTNGSAADTAATIAGDYAGVGVTTAAGTVTNFGFIESVSNGTQSSAGVYLTAGGLVTNGSTKDTGAGITGNVGVLTQVAAATVINDGYVGGAGTMGVGVDLEAGGLVTNGSMKDTSARINGTVGAKINGTGVLTNFGTITGTGGVAVQFLSSTDTLNVEAGSTFVGKVLGDAGLLDLASGVGAINNLTGGNVTVSGSMASTTFINFGTVEIGGGASFTVAGAGNIIAGHSLIDAGTLKVAGTLTVGGYMITTATGRTTLASAVKNTGTLTVSGGHLTVDGAVTGAGVVHISGGTADFASTFRENVTFTGTTGVLELAHSETYTGTITGFSKTDTTSLDLRDIAFATATWSYIGTTVSGVLTVKDGTHTAHIKLSGDYTGSAFTLSKDATGGTRVVDPPTSGAPSLLASSPLHCFIAAAASFGAGAGVAVTTTSEAWRASQPALVAPRAQIA
jgi:hypothetical protein